MKPVWKWVIAIGICLIAALFAGGWYLSRHWKPILDTKLKEAVVNASDSLYRISYDELDFNLLTGNASIENLRLTADTNVYARLKLREQAPDNIYDIHVANLRIKRFRPQRILMGRKLNIDDIIIDTPAIHIINEYHAYNDTVTTQTDSRTLYQRLSNVLNEVSVENVQLNDIHFKFTKKTDSIAQETRLGNIQINIRDILIDSLSQYDTTRFFHTRAIDVDVPAFRYETPDSFYYVSFDRLQVASEERQLVLSGLKYAPRMNKAEFYRRKQQAKDMVILSLPHIRVENIDLQRLIRRQKLYAGSLHVDSGTVAVSNDMRYPKPFVSKIGKSPHQLLLKLQQPLKIDSLLIQDVSVSYAEVSRKYEEEGKITFDRISGVIQNVTNDTLALMLNKTMEADLTTHMMNTGKLDVAFTFDMLDKRGAYTYKGRLGPMNGRSLNRIITPLLNVEVASANIKGLSFDMQADDYRAWGNLQLDYDNMKMTLFTTDEDGKKSPMKVVSFLANSFIINDSNPDANGKYHRGRINFTRPHDYSFFKSMWKSLLEGIKQCSGISKEREQRLMQRADEAKKASEKTGGFFKRVFGGKERDKEN